MCFKDKLLINYNTIPYERLNKAFHKNDRINFFTLLKAISLIYNIDKVQSIMIDNNFSMIRIDFSGVEMVWSVNDNIINKALDLRKRFLNTNDIFNRINPNEKSENYFYSDENLINYLFNLEKMINALGFSFGAYDSQRYSDAYNYMIGLDTINASVGKVHSRLFIHNKFLLIIKQSPHLRKIIFVKFLRLMFIISIFNTNSKVNSINIEVEQLHDIKVNLKTSFGDFNLLLDETLDKQVENILLLVGEI